MSQLQQRRGLQYPHKKVDQLVEERRGLREQTINHSSYSLYLLVCLPTKIKEKKTSRQQTCCLVASEASNDSHTLKQMKLTVARFAGLNAKTRFFVLFSAKRKAWKRLLLSEAGVSHTQDKSFQKERPTREFLNGFNPPGLFYFIMHSF